MFEAKHITLPASPVSQKSGRPHYLRPGFCVLGALAVLSQLLLAYQYFSTYSQQWHHTEDPANSTLGFGAIYTVSRPDSPRRHSLMSAASLTGLEINIPVQPVWTENDVSRIHAPENSSLDRGSALAWLGHQNALKTFLESNKETALIMEDDVDWDVRLRQDQIPQTAFAIRELLGSHSGEYYGNTNDWDIIWLGHCGDFFDASQGSALSVIKSYHDSAMPDLHNLHPWTRDFLHGIGATQNRQRLVHESVSPLCTFAYAITRAAAERVLTQLAVSEPMRDTGHPCKAYDVRLLEGCRDEGLKCISVNPELFHHSSMVSEIARVSNDLSPTTAEPIEDSGSAPTNNIRCSARSKKWQEIKESIADTSINVEDFVKDLAERSPYCYIDDL